MWDKALLLAAERYDGSACREVLRVMKERGVKMSNKTFALVIAAHKKNWNSVENILGHMSSLSISHTIHSHVQVLQAIRYRKDLTPAQVQTHAEALYHEILAAYPTSPFKPVVHAAMLAACQSFPEAMKYRSLLSKPDTATVYRRLLSVCSRSRDPANAEAIIDEMYQKGFTVASDTYALLMKCHSNDTAGLLKAWKTMKSKIPSSQICLRAYLAFINSCGAAFDVSEVKFAEAIDKRGYGTEAELWFAMLRLYAAHGEDDKFKLLYSRMFLFGIKPKADILDHSTRLHTAPDPHPDNTLTAALIANFANEEFEDTYWKHGKGHRPSVPVIEVL
eukprot:TRINITY_DN743_c0_g3_i1.p1 TRINITY_DN743_c0_g3~~TRINITY_DN743_c0_g3_i1.p1  ORF type:complete len:381 (+),score=93.00 TRINITY_DN743_c0_g3_i1:144-1145(+)